MAQQILFFFFIDCTFSLRAAWSVVVTGHGEPPLAVVLGAMATWRGFETSGVVGRSASRLPLFLQPPTVSCCPFTQQYPLHRLPSVILFLLLKSISIITQEREQIITMLG